MEIENIHLPAKVFRESGNDIFVFFGGQIRIFDKFEVLVHPGP
jgi:hypothetical protein